MTPAPFPRRDMPRMYYSAADRACREAFRRNVEGVHLPPVVAAHLELDNDETWRTCDGKVSSVSDPDSIHLYASDVSLRLLGFDLEWFDRYGYDPTPRDYPAAGSLP